MNLREIDVNRTFGVEIEFLNAEKAKIQLPENYKYTENEFTALHNTDCSMIRNKSDIGGEINSPPLTFTRKDIRPLRTLFNQIWEVGGELNWYVDFHVHFFIGDLSLNEIRKVNDAIYIYAQNLKQIFHLPEWNDTKYACPPLDYETWRKVDLADDFEKVFSAYRNGSNRGVFRPYISLGSLEKLGTVEFRLFAGTKSFRTVLEYISFVYKFIDFALSTSYEEKEQVKDLVELLKINTRHIHAPRMPFLYAEDHNNNMTLIGSMFKKGKEILNIVKRAVGKRKAVIYNSYFFDVEQALKDNEKIIYTSNAYVILLYDIILNDKQIDLPDSWDWLEISNEKSKAMRIAKFYLYLDLRTSIDSTSIYSIRKYQNAQLKRDKILEKMIARISKIIERVSGKIEIRYGNVIDAIEAAKEEKAVFIYQGEEDAKMRGLHNTLKRELDFNIDRLKTDYSLIKDLADYVIIGRNMFLPYELKYSNGRQFVYSDLIETTYKKILSRKTVQLYYKELPKDYEIRQDSQIKFIRAKGSEVDFIRQKYLAKNIVMGSAVFNYLWFIDDYLFGASMLDFPKRKNDGSWSWLKSDFVIDSDVPKLSKLLLMAILSVEYKNEVSIKYKQIIEAFVTNVFTDKPVSMKYRGAFTKIDKMPGKLTYLGEAGKYGTLENVIKEYFKTIHRSGK